MMLGSNNKVRKQKAKVARLKKLRIIRKVTGINEADEEENKLNDDISHGVISVMGRRRVMEDVVRVVHGCNVSIFGISEGGDTAAEAMGVLLEKLVNVGGRRSGLVSKWEKVMTKWFAKMGGDGSAVVVVGKEEVVVAHCGGGGGGSRAIICCGGVMHASLDYKPDQKEGMEIGGGIGDQNVVVKAKIEVNKRTEIDEFMIIGSNGFWCVVPNDFACEVVRKCLTGEIRNGFAEVDISVVAAAMLSQLALARGSKGNISVIVVEL